LGRMLPSCAGGGAGPLRTLVPRVVPEIRGAAGMRPVDGVSLTGSDRRSESSTSTGWAQPASPKSSAMTGKRLRRPATQKPARSVFCEHPECDEHTFAIKRYATRINRLHGASVGQRIAHGP